jgi:hypothetical protein
MTQPADTEEVVADGWAQAAGAAPQLSAIGMDDACKLSEPA